MASVTARAMDRKIMPINGTTSIVTMMGSRWHAAEYVRMIDGSMKWAGSYEFSCSTPSMGAHFTLYSILPFTHRCPTMASTMYCSSPYRNFDLLRTRQIVHLHCEFEEWFTTVQSRK